MIDQQEVLLFGMPAALLLQAREELKRVGWVSQPELSAMRPFDQAVDHRQTLIAAVEDVVPWDGVTPRKVIELLARRVGIEGAWAARYEEIVRDIEAWEAKPSRTFDDVLAVLVPR